MSSVNAGADFDHALGNLRLDLPDMRLLFQKRQQVGRGTCEIMVARVHKLQFELNAHAEHFRLFEFENRRHQSLFSPKASPDRTRANCVRGGPMNSRIRIADIMTVAIEGLKSGYNMAV